MSSGCPRGVLGGVLALTSHLTLVEHFDEKDLLLRFQHLRTRTLRTHSLRTPELCLVVRMTSVASLLYASTFWWGFTTASRIRRALGSRGIRRGFVLRGSFRRFPAKDHLRRPFTCTQAIQCTSLTSCHLDMTFGPEHLALLSLLRTHLTLCNSS